GRSTRAPSLRYRRPVLASVDEKITADLDEIEQSISCLGQDEANRDDVGSGPHVFAYGESLHLSVDLAPNWGGSHRGAVDKDRRFRTGESVNNQVKMLRGGDDVEI